jgi:hypothetical protein
MAACNNDQGYWAHDNNEGKTVVKGTVPRDFRLLVFFHESYSPQPQSIPLGPFRIFSKIRGDIRSSRLTTGVVDTSGK